MTLNEFKESFPENLRSETVITCLYSMLKLEYLKYLEYISMGTSFGSESFGFNFPSLYDEGDEEYFESGVELYTYSNEEIVPDKDFIHYIDITSKVFMSINPDKKDEIISLMNIIKKM